MTEDQVMLCSQSCKRLRCDFNISPLIVSTKRLSSSKQGIAAERNHNFHVSKSFQKYLFRERSS